jgi:dipeptidyl aminopeptidase/acylaminoacyl peptidase
MGVLTVSGALIAAQPEAITSLSKPDVRHYTIEQLFAARRNIGAEWSPDGRRFVFVSNISGRFNLWTVSAEGGWPTQLTVSDQRQYRPAWSPDGQWIAYESDYDGNEQWDLFLVSTQNGEVLNLTQTPDIAESGPEWSHNGKLLAYTVKPKVSSVHEIYVMDMATRRARALTSGTPANLGNYGPRWSPDDRFIAFTERRADGKDSNIFLLEVATGTITNLTQHTGEIDYSVSDWSPDGKRLLITSNAKNGYNNVAILDLGTRALQWLTEGHWEIEAGNWSPDGRQVTWTANVDGNVEIYVNDLTTGKEEALPIRKGVNHLTGGNSAFSRDGRRLAYFHSGADSPGDLYVCELSSGKSQQITQSLVAGVRTEDLVEPYLVHYASFDGRMISAFLYVPYNLKKDRSNPALVSVHGGPTAQSLNNFSAGTQYLVNQGYVVIAPNYRGGSGYGKEFQDSNRFDMGGGDLKDVLQAAKFLESTGYVEPKKIVIMGGSYGGYMTMMGVTKAPEVWAAGVAIVPFVNWFTEVQHEDPLLQQYDLATMGDPAKNKALWEDRSPINYIQNIRAPLMLLAGGHDPRCPREEADQVAEAVRARGGVVEYQVYENEGHGFSRLENQIASFKRIAAFLNKYVK